MTSAWVESPNRGWVRTSCIEAVTIWSDAGVRFSVLLHTGTGPYVHKKFRTKDEALSEAERITKLIVETEDQENL